jgi:hypothetical protein
MKKTQKTNLKSGLVLVNVLVFGVIAIIVTTALINWAVIMIKSMRQLTYSEQAVQIAEAGIDYYRWHLAHAPTDYKDGNATTTNGPFIHDFKDKSGNTIGQFSLYITPPPIGSTLTKIKSVGTVLDAPGVQRAIQVTLGIPSFAKYAVVANDYMNFGSGTEIFGLVHSNNGIHYDGLAHNIVTSSKDTFSNPDVGGAIKYGVYTTLGDDDPNPPTPYPDRPDVFMAGRQFPVPVVDFLGITSDLAKMKADAIENGKYFASSGVQGYRIVLKTNDTFDIYKVKNLAAAPTGCANSQNETGWGTWSIKSPLNNTNMPLFQSNVPFPTNGIIFVEDHVWIDGQVDTAKLTIAAGRFPDNSTTWRNIIVNDNLRYTNYDGRDTVALIAQGSILTGLYDAPTGNEDLRIDAAIIAQNGKAARYYYSSACGTTYLMNNLTLFGMIATNKRYGFAWGNSTTVTTGFLERNIIYDGNLLYSPPPSFPLTSNEYTTISWEEIE